MKFLLIMAILTILHQTNTNKRMKRQAKEKDFNLNFGLSTALKERLHPEIIEKSLIGKYISNEFISLVLAPVMNEIERCITKLESIDNKLEKNFNEKKTILNMALMAVSILGPTTLVILLILLIYLERKQGNLRAKFKKW